MSSELFWDFTPNESKEARDTEVTTCWNKLCKDVVAWDAAKTSAKYIARNDLKAIRYVLAVNFMGRISNLHNVYRNDLFRLWNIEMGNTLNMGVMCKRWLTTQSQDNTINICIEPFLSRLCQGLGLEGKMRREGELLQFHPSS
nr:hypothetical protein Iba_chr13bCG10720 [Ipomoea batatas]